MDAHGVPGTGEIPDLGTMSGGSQNELTVIERGGRTMVMRRPPHGAVDDRLDGIRREHRLVRALKGADVPHAGYIAGTDDADTLQLHVGQTVTLTLLMHPAGEANLTSGMLPRRAIALARNWVGPGLAAIAPSLRTGPVLVETDLDADAQVRLPKISVFGNDQNFLWRDTPGSWRTDAATPGWTPSSSARGSTASASRNAAPCRGSSCSMAPSPRSDRSRSFPICSLALRPRPCASGSAHHSERASGGSRA
jgi:hypothetical protein